MHINRDNLKPPMNKVIKFIKLYYQMQILGKAEYLHYKKVDVSAGDILASSCVIGFEIQNTNTCKVVFRKISTTTNIASNNCVWKSITSFNLSECT